MFYSNKYQHEIVCAYFVRQTERWRWIGEHTDRNTDCTQPCCPHNNLHSFRTVRSPQKRAAFTARAHCGSVGTLLCPAAAGLSLSGLGRPPPVRRSVCSSSATGLRVHTVQENCAFADTAAHIRTAHHQCNKTQRIARAQPPQVCTPRAHSLTCQVQKKVIECITYDYCSVSRAARIADGATFTCDLLASVYTVRVDYSSFRVCAVVVVVFTFIFRVRLCVRTLLFSAPPMVLRSGARRGVAPNARLNFESIVQTCTHTRSNMRLC